jgi:hypothetical protein
VGVGWVDAADEEDQTRRRSRVRLDEPTDTSGSEAVDREALRAALREVLAEERAAAGTLEEAGKEPEGVSAADVLASLERAYRAELEAKGRVAALDAAALDGAPLDGAAPEAALKSAPVPEASDPAQGDEPVDSTEPDDEIGGAETRPRLAHRREQHGAERPPRQQSVAQVDAASLRAEPEPEPSRASAPDVRVGTVNVHQGDVNHVDARRLSVVNQYQQYQSVFFYAPPVVPSLPPSRAAAGTSGQSPLSQPTPSAHHQSPWSPVDYSKHHNPWGPTFGRRIP